MRRLEQSARRAGRRGRASGGRSRRGCSAERHSCFSSSFSWDGAVGLLGLEQVVDVVAWGRQQAIRLSVEELEAKMAAAQQVHARPAPHHPVIGARSDPRPSSPSPFNSWQSAAFSRRAPRRRADVAAATDGTDAAPDGASAYAIRRRSG